MQFASDNWTGGAPEVIDALAEAAALAGRPMAATITKAVERRFAELFEHEVTVFLVASGTSPTRSASLPMRGPVASCSAIARRTSLWTRLVGWSSWRRLEDRGS